MTPRLPAIEELVPHRPPMLLIDELTSADEHGATCRALVRADSPFLSAGKVPAWTALEYCAQCVAAYVGWLGFDNGEAPRVGFLVAARDFSLETDHFEPGEELAIDARLTFGQARVGRFECRVRRGESVVASASLSVYQPEDRDEPSGSQR